MSTKRSIGVVGAGYVGGTVAKGFEHCGEVRVYDILPKRCTHSFEDVVNSDFVFVALPTPMVSAEGGEANLEIIFDFFKKVKSIGYKSNSIFIIKSTVPIGTTKKISKQFGMSNIVHNPEFLREATALEDFLHPSRIIIGGQCPGSIKKVKELFYELFPEVRCYIMSSDASEMVKYMANSFLATKVIFFNEMYLLAEKLDISWNDLIKGVLSDKRIGRSHYQVPGPDLQRGIGGACFPKDINALIKTMEDNGIDPLLLKAGWEQNKRIRKDWDWEKNPSAVRSSSINPKDFEK